MCFFCKTKGHVTFFNPNLLKQAFWIFCQAVIGKHEFAKWVGAILRYLCLPFFAGRRVVFSFFSLKKCWEFLHLKMLICKVFVNTCLYLIGKPEFRKIGCSYFAAHILTIFCRKKGLVAFFRLETNDGEFHAAIGKHEFHKAHCCCFVAFELPFFHSRIGRDTFSTRNNCDKFLASNSFNLKIVHEYIYIFNRYLKNKLKKSNIP